MSIKFKNIKNPDYDKPTEQDKDRLIEKLKDIIQQLEAELYNYRFNDSK